MLIYYLDKFYELEPDTISTLQNPSKLLRVLTKLDTSITKVHIGALIVIERHIVAELWVETKDGLFRALITDHDRESLLRLWNEIDRSLREDYERFIGISIGLQEVSFANKILELVMYESRRLGESVILLSTINTSELPKVKKYIHFQPWEGLLILKLNDRVSIYKASRVALKQAISEIERMFKLEIEILDRRFLEA